MKRWIPGVAIALVLTASALAALALVALRGGISARPEPSVLEAAIARRVRHLAIPASARERKNPFAGSEAVLPAGRAHFADHCALCHGNDGKGQTPLGKGLYPRPPDLTAAATQRLSDGELFAIIEDGVRFTGMPAFGVEGAPDPSWHLVTFIRHLPSLTSEELRGMERLNPRSPAEWKELQEEDEFLEGPAPSEPGARGE